MDKIDEMVNRLKKISEVKTILLFGSHAKGRQRKDSDIDLCVITSKETDRPLECSSKEFDISLFHELPLTIQYRVFRDGKVLLNRDDKLFTKMKFWTITHYLDEKHWRDRAVQKVLA